MKTKPSPRNSVRSLIPLFCAISMAPTLVCAQRTQPSAVAPHLQAVAPHLQSVVLDGSTRAGWYSFPGQSPKLTFKGNQVKITSGDHSTVLLSRGSGIANSAAEVSLTQPPSSSSSVSGLAVLSDARHAMVIGLSGGDVVLWQMDPAGAKIVASQPVNADSPLAFRVIGGTPADVRFFWRHQKDGAWHILGNPASNAILSSWPEPLSFGLLLDGPQGSEVTFSDYRAAVPGMAANTPAQNQMTAMLVSGE